MKIFCILLSLISVIMIQQSISFQFKQEFIGAGSFYQLMPCLDEHQVDMLIDYLNGVPDESLRIQEINRWLDENWIPASEFVPNNVRKKCDNYITDKQADKEWIRYQLITFVRHRSAIKTYINFLYRATRDLGYFNETEAIAMRDTFWGVDKFHGNFFGSVEPAFFRNAAYQYEKTDKKVETQLSILARTLENMPDYDKLLEWRFYQDL